MIQGFIIFTADRGQIDLTNEQVDFLAKQSDSLGRHFFQYTSSLANNDRKEIISKENINLLNKIRGIFVTISKENQTVQKITLKGILPLQDLKNKDKFNELIEEFRNAAGIAIPYFRIDSHNTTIEEVNILLDPLINNLLSEMRDRTEKEKNTDNPFGLKSNGQYIESNESENNLYLHVDNQTVETKKITINQQEKDFNKELEIQLYKKGFEGIRTEDNQLAEENVIFNFSLSLELKEKLNDISAAESHCLYFTNEIISTAQNKIGKTTTPEEENEKSKITLGKVLKIGGITILIICLGGTIYFFVFVKNDKELPVQKPQELPDKTSERHLEEQVEEKLNNQEEKSENPSSADLVEKKDELEATNIKAEQEQHQEEYLADF